jgi:hypothetical protein
MLTEGVHRRALEAGYKPIVRPHQFRHTFANDWQMGRIASDATFPGRRDHGAAGDAKRVHREGAGADPHESAGQGRHVSASCIRRINVEPDSVASSDGMLQLLQRQNRSDEGRCPLRPVVMLTYSARA